MRTEQTGGESTGALLDLDPGFVGFNGDREPVGNDEDARHGERYSQESGVRSRVGVRSRESGVWSQVERRF
jgi:hypothetical protein